MTHLGLMQQSALAVLINAVWPSVLSFRHALVSC